jgi:hypothetical protein
MRNGDVEAVRRCYLSSGLADEQFAEVIEHGSIELDGESLYIKDAARLMQMGLD